MGNIICRYNEANIYALEKIVNDAKERARANGLSERNTTVGFSYADKDDEVNIVIKNHDNPSRKILLHSARIKALDGNALASLRYKEEVYELGKPLGRKLAL